MLTWPRQCSRVNPKENSQRDFSGDTPRLAGGEKSEGCP